MKERQRLLNAIEKHYSGEYSYIREKLTEYLNDLAEDGARGDLFWFKEICESYLKEST
jgi:predicted DNA-binding protein